MTAQRSRAVAALALTMLIWGTSAVFMRTTALTLSPENALALRYVLLVPMVVVGLLATGHWRIAREHWPRLITSPNFSAYYQQFRAALCQYVESNFRLPASAVGPRIDAAALGLFQRGYCGRELDNPEDRKSVV